MNKIKPKIKTPTSQIKFDELDVGDCFLMDNDLWIKIDDVFQLELEQPAVCLSNGKIMCYLCGVWVILVDTETTWKKSTNIKTE
jgi:hypothetical protein